MKHSFLSLCTVSAGLILLSSCRKLADYFRPDKDSNCKITKITQAASNNINNTRDGYFTYNEAGDLAKITFNGKDFGAGENIEWLFNYDANRRLIRIDRKQNPDLVFERYSTITFTWQNNRITHQYTVLRGFDFEHRIYDSIVYDNQGRVSADYLLSETLSSVPPPRQSRDTVFYAYNNRGNLVYPGKNVQYTNKKTFLRTDPLLMFLHRNFSKNEAIPAKSYTSEGLPTGFPADISKPLPFAFFESNYITGIEYQCEE